MSIDENSFQAKQTHSVPLFTCTIFSDQLLVLRHHLRLRVALLPKIECFHTRDGDDRAVIQPDLNGFKSFFDGLGKDQFFSCSWHG